MYGAVGGMLRSGATIHVRVLYVNDVSNSSVVRVVYIFSYVSFFSMPQSSLSTDLVASSARIWSGGVARTDLVWWRRANGSGLVASSALYPGLSLGFLDIIPNANVRVEIRLFLTSYLGLSLLLTAPKRLTIMYNVRTLLILYLARWTIFPGFNSGKGGTTCC